MGELIFLGTEYVDGFSNGNNRFFICNAQVACGNRIFKGTGAGNTLVQAQETAKSNAIACANGVVMHKQNVDFSNCSNQHFASQTKDRLNGGGTKPATQAQINLVEKLARENMRNGAEVASAAFGKQLGELTGSQADSLIKQLKGAK